MILLISKLLFSAAIIAALCFVWAWKPKEKTFTLSTGTKATIRGDYVVLSPERNGEITVSAEALSEALSIHGGGGCITVPEKVKSMKEMVGREAAKNEARIPGAGGPGSGDFYKIEQ